MRLPANVIDCNIGRELVETTSPDAPVGSYREFVLGPTYTVVAELRDGRKFAKCGTTLDALIDDLRRYARRPASVDANGRPA